MLLTRSSTLSLLPSRRTTMAKQPSRLRGGMLRCLVKRRWCRRTNTPSSTERRGRIGRAFIVSCCSDCSSRIREFSRLTDTLHRAPQVDESQPESQSSWFLIPFLRLFLLRSGGYRQYPPSLSSLSCYFLALNRKHIPPFKTVHYHQLTHCTGYEVQINLETE